jgi:hypothetical protein
VRIVKNALITLLQLLLATVGIAQEHASQDVVSTLLPDHNARRIVDLKPEEKSKALKRLQFAQKQATGERSQEVAFLLAAYGFDYETNRDYLVHALRGCTSPSIKFGCNDNTGAFLIVLYERGHKELLEPLMLLGKDSYNAALAESVGAFYSDVLIKNPTEFLDTIQRFAPRTQQRVCELAGSGDGGGMSPADLQRVRKQLRAKGGDLAARCLRAVGTANKPQ